MGILPSHATGGYSAFIPHTTKLLLVLCVVFLRGQYLQHPLLLFDEMLTTRKKKSAFHDEEVDKSIKILNFSKVCAHLQERGVFDGLNNVVVNEHYFHSILCELQSQMDVIPLE